MNATATVLQPTLAQALWPTTERGQWVRAGLLALLGSAFIAASAQVVVPLWPVPITGQTFAVLVIGMMFGARLGAATVVLYLVEGAVGLPVFHRLASGLPFLMGTTGGYLVGFPFAAGLVGYLAERGWDRSWVRTAAAMIIGNIVIYACGVSWLASLIGIEKAIQLGLTPFLVGDLLKIALATALLPWCWTLAPRLRD